MNIQNNINNKTAIHNEQQLKTKQENTQYLKENIKQQKIDESQMKLTGNIIGEASYIFSSTFETPEGMKL